MVCILRGCVAPNWTMARELMNSMTFKLELMLMDPTKIKPSLVKKCLQILNSNQKSLTPVFLLEVDKGASILLTWVINLLKWHTGVLKYNFQANSTGDLLPHMESSIGDNAEFASHH